MKILIDGLIIDKNKAGIGQYSYSVIQGLKNRKDFDYTFLLQDNIQIDSDKAWYLKEFKKSYERIAFQQSVLHFKSRNFDLVHYMDYSSPIIKTTKPFILTIHDLSFYKYPETFSTGSRKLKQFLTPIGVNRAARIITDSENTKRDLIEYFPQVEKKVRVIYPAASGYYKEDNEEKLSCIKNKYNIKGKYILGVGTLEPRKNLIRLLQAFKHLSEEFKDINLVLVGKKGWLYDKIIEELGSEDLRNRVLSTGYVDQEDMSGIYSGAECFVYPSLYEGFGLPPLEAMSCGVPVIVSKASSLPEVVGDAAILVDPLDTKELEENIKNVLTNTSLKKQLVEKGLTQCKKFNWETTINQIVDVYKEVLY